MIKFLKKAIELSKESVEKGGFPVGAVVVKDNKIIGEGLSNGKNNKDATSHAEIEAIRDASRSLDSRDLFDCEIYSSMEPCLMCFSATYWAKIKRVVYAVGKDKLPKEHFEGTYDLREINLKNNKLIEIVHVKDLEKEALDVIRDWEKNRKNSV